MKKIIALVMVSIVAFGLIAGCSPANEPSQSDDSDTSTAGGFNEADRAGEFITVATGPTSGIYYPIGGAFATALSEYGYKTSAEATNASGANIQLIQDGDAELAIAMQDAVMQAYTASGSYEGQEAATEMASIMRLWPNYVQLVTTADTGINSISDLVGKRVGVGAPNSGVEINAKMILNAYGITYDDITPDFLSYSEAIENMKNGQCDAVFVTSGIPNATIMELGVSYDMKLVPIDGEGRDNLIEQYPYYAKTIVPANTYNNEEDIEGVFVYNILIAPTSLSDEMVYDILEGIFAGLDTIKASHNAANANISMDVGVSDLQLPLHPGAEKFWADNGY